jgi:RNA polymerase sigma-32 factor
MQHHRDGALSHYIARAQQEPVLTREEEIELGVRWRTRGDREAADRLIRSHVRYVVATALKYRHYGVPVNELVAEGNFGLTHAVALFEPDRGIRFVTYAAYWIRAYILNYVIRCWSMVGGGAGPLRSKLFFRLRRERIRAANLVGDGEHADRLMGESLGMKSDKVAQMVRRLETRDLSLDAPTYSDSPRPWIDTLVSEGTDQEMSLANAELTELARNAVRVALATLDPRERYVVQARLLADGEEQLSLAEIGRKLRVSRERARQLESRAKQKLRVAITQMERRSGQRWLGDLAA